VLVTDWASPGKSALARVADLRARQYWDSGRMLSKALGERDSNSIVWDHVFVYAPGTGWGASPPDPGYQGRPVVKGADALRRALDQLNVSERAEMVRPHR